MGNVFVSKPNALTKVQTNFWVQLRELLEQRNLVPRTLGETDYPNGSPISAVRDLMISCDGAIVLGFQQIEVLIGTEKKDTPKKRSVNGARFPTPWNQIEAAMAFAFEKPVLILREEGVSGGIFELGNTDRFIHSAELTSDWLRSQQFLQPLTRWQEEMAVRRSKKS